MKLKHVFGTVNKSPDGADYDIDVICSTDCVDRDDEVIEQDGWDLAAFRANPVFLAAHQHRLADGRSSVIGSFAQVGVEAAPDGRKQLAGRVKFADTELGREYRTLYRDGHMRAVSVGFRPMDSEMRPVDTAAPRGPQRRHLTHCELWEVSAVPVPANPEALARLRAAGVLGEDDQADERVGRAVAAGLQEAVKQTLDEGLTRIQAAVMDRLDEFLACLPDYRSGGSDDCPGEVAPAGDDRPDATPARAAGGPTTGAEEIARAARQLAAALEKTV